MLAIQHRIHSLSSLPQLIALVSALKDNVRTNLRPIELRQLARVLAPIPKDRIRQIGLDDRNVLVRRDLPDGTYVLSTKDGTFTALQRYLASALASAPGN